MQHDGIQSSTQAPTPAGWENIHDIRWMAENLNSAQFRALSSGLGLGTIKTAQSRVSASVFPHLSASTPVLGTQSSFRSPSTQGMLHGEQELQRALLTSQPTAPVEKASSSIFRTARRGANAASQAPQRASAAPVRQTQKLSFKQRLSVWTADFLVVVTSLAVAFAIAVVLSMVKSGETDNWLALRPVKFLAARTAVEILAAVYAAFAAYMVVFKLGAGKTFGELIFARRQAKNTSSVTS